MILSSENIITRIRKYETGTPRGWTVLELNSVEKKEVKKNIGNDTGIYIIRCDKKIQRIKGESCIIYIGSGGLRTRLISLLDFSFVEFLNETKRKHTAKSSLKRIHDELDFKIEVLFIKVRQPSAKEIESQLIEDYCLNHIEPPPLNHTRK
jgi:hypothetical protein